MLSSKWNACSKTLFVRDAVHRWLESLIACWSGHADRCRQSLFSKSKMFPGQIIYADVSEEVRVIHNEFNRIVVTNICVKFDRKLPEQALSICVDSWDAFLPASFLSTKKSFTFVLIPHLMWMSHFFFMMVFISDRLQKQSDSFNVVCDLSRSTCKFWTRKTGGEVFSLCFGMNAIPERLTRERMADSACFESVRIIISLCKSSPVSSHLTTGHSLVSAVSCTCWPSLESPRTAKWSRESTLEATSSLFSLRVSNIPRWVPVLM